MFTKILIANRGEIACRVMRTCRRMGIATVAVYSDVDRRALHVREADEAIAIGPAMPAASYLHVERIIAAALRSGAQAIHPGYGFLSERAHFAAACQAAGVVFIGPPASAVTLMGDKIAAKRLAIQAGVPTVPGFQPPVGEEMSAAQLVIEAERIGCPLLIKAAAGGGGKGMRVVEDLAQFAAALAAAQREALAAFGDSNVFLERLIQHPRHVEFQILADQYGHCVHLFERECSIQRRHQKILEESPSPAMTHELRIQMGSAAVRLAQAAGYVNAGTVEFLLGEDRQFFFLEMNTRLQVEHPITEYTTGLDLVQLQIEIAAGAALPFQQEQLVQNGHAIEVRVCAEDPGSFLPTTGHIALFASPSATEARTDAGVETGDEISMYYDSLIAKVIVHAPDRISALQRIQAALTHIAVLGVTTNIPLLGAIVAHPAFHTGDTTTDFLVRNGLECTAPNAPPAEVLIAAGLLSMEREIESAYSDPWVAGSWRHSQSGALRRFVYCGSEYTVTMERSGTGFRALLPGDLRLITHYRATTEWLLFGDDTQHWDMPFVWQASGLLVGWQGWQFDLELAQGLRVESTQLGFIGDPHVRLEAPMPGTVIRMLVGEGDQVAADTPLLVIEAMKMEHVVVAPYAGLVQRIHVSVGSMVSRGEVLAEVERAD